MDPNACLAEIRRILANEDKDGDDLPRLADLIEALDNWLSNRGFMPDAWQIDGIGNAGRYGGRLVGSEPWGKLRK